MNIRKPGLALLALTVCAGLSACDPSPDLPAEMIRIDAATAGVVNGAPIYFTDVELEAAAQGLIGPGDPFGLGHPDYQAVLDQLIDQQLMAQEALRRDLHLEPSARRRLDSARQRVLGNILVESLVAERVTEDTIRQMYGEQVKLQQIDDEVLVRHILTQTREEAESARQRVLGGEDFTTVAFEVSRDTRTRIEGGSLGYVEPARLGEPYTSAIADTPTGEISQPFESDQGWHIFKVEERRTPPPATLEEMRPDIVTFLTYEQISRILRELRNQAVISPGSGVPRLAPSDIPGEDTEAEKDDTL